MSVYNFPNADQYTLIFFNEHRQLALVNKTTGVIEKGFILRDHQNTFNRYLRIWNFNNILYVEILQALPHGINYTTFRYSPVSGQGQSFFIDDQNMIVGTGDLRLIVLPSKTDLYPIANAQNNAFVIWNYMPNQLYIYSLYAPSVNAMPPNNYVKD